MTARDPAERHRGATPLEAFFDLCFVVAVGSAAEELFHALREGHVGAGVLGYAMVFFAIWWAWMNFTWFASAYDNDDVFFRALTFLQIAGVLVLAAGVPRAFDHRDFTVVTIGYVIMRTAMVAQWLRAAHDDPEGRATSLRYAAGVFAVQVCWVVRLALPSPWGMAGFAVLVVAELAVPAWAERAGVTHWHPGHITERFGLFNLIVLGEVVLAATDAVQAGVTGGTAIGYLITVGVSAFLIVVAMWWMYFDYSAEDVIGAGGMRSSLTWGYGHYLIFSAAAAVGAGLEVAIARDSDARRTGLAVAVPLVVYLLVTWLVCGRRSQRGTVRLALVPAACVLILPVPLAGVAPSVGLPVVAAVAVALVTVHIVIRHRAGEVRDPVLDSVPP